MIQVVIVLNKVECLDEIIKRFIENDISGGTIINSYGMARSIGGGDDEEIPLFSILKSMFEFDDASSKIIFMIAEESQVRTISKIVNEVTGGLQNPNTGIMFCTPVVYIEGLRKNKPETLANKSNS